MIVEEMSGASDPFHLKVAACGQSAQKLFEGRERRDVVFGPVDKELRFRATGEEIQIVHPRRRADGDQSVHAIVRTPHFQTDDRAERKTGDDDFARVRLAVEKIIERDLRVGAFTTPFIELARAQSDAAKVEPQCLEAALVQSLRRAEYHLVVHSAAVQRVWMQDQRDPLGLIAFRAIDRFQPPVCRRNEKISRRIHRSIRQQNFESPRPLRFGHRLYAFGQWVFERDERLDVHPAGFEQPERGFKTPAARTYHAHLVNDYPGSVESNRAAKSGLQDNRAARPDQIEREFYSARRPARFDHEIEARRLYSDDFSRHVTTEVATTKGVGD